MSVFLSEMLMPGMAERKRPSVVRCLFPIDDNDRERLNQELDNQARKIDEVEAKRFEERWQFDPLKGVPTEGSKFEYTLMDRKSMPAMYTSTYRHRPSRPVSMQRARSLYQTRISTTSSPRPTKRKLRFEGDYTASNDENREIHEDEIDGPIKQARLDTDVMDIGRESESSRFSRGVSPISTTTFNNSSFCLSSPPASPPSSSLQQPSNTPPSPSVLSSSCPAVLESDSVQSRLHHVDMPGLSRSLSDSSFELSTLSPGEKTREYVTPAVKPKPVTLVQREITDYGYIRKKRCSLKGSPRS